MTKIRISFIGAGRMAEALISRLASRHSIIAFDVKAERLKYLKRKYRIKTTGFGEIVVLAVKPKDVPEISLSVSRRQLIISIAAGVPLSYLQKKFPASAVIRAMPNNPALVGEGITALSYGKKVSARQRKAAENIFRSVGEVVFVPESWMDAVTGLSGSGPAFVYQVIEGLIRGGVKAGLPSNVAAELALQTVIGAAKTVKTTAKSPKELTEMVASPGGTTVEGLKVLGKYRTIEAFTEAVAAAARKSKQLSRKFTS